MPTKLTLETFIDRANTFHDFKYDYTLSKYTGQYNKIKISCPIHGEFIQTAKHHMSGRGCSKCGDISKAKNKTFTQKEYLEKVKITHNDRYSYSKTEYIHNTKKVIITCKEHGDFKMSAGAHLHGQGCPICRYVSSSEKITLSLAEVLERFKEVHKDRYDYSHFKYNGCDQKSTIICKLHGYFKHLTFLIIIVNKDVDSVVI